MRIEPVMAALFARLESLKTAGLLVTASRKLEHINDFELNLMPAGFQHQTGIQVTSVKSGPQPKNRMGVEWYLYVPGNSDGVHAPVLNVLIEEAAALLKPDSPIDGACTLGGICTNVYIEGTIELFEGVLHDRAVAIIPLTVVMPGY